MSDDHAQAWNPDAYARNARFVAELGAPLLEWLAPAPGERILDLGCGDGALTAALVDAGCRVVGVDASREFVERARRNGIDAHCMDGQRLEFSAHFDAVFSNAALHWMKDADAVIAGVARALRAGGRFVGEMGGAGNVASIVDALQEELRARGVDPAAFHPWYFPDAHEYAARLEAHGFEVRRIELFARPTPLPGDLGGWLETFAGPFCAALPVPDRQGYLDAVSARAAPALRDADGLWTADYVRLRFAAALS